MPLLKAEKRFADTNSEQTLWFIDIRPVERWCHAGPNFQGPLSFFAKLLPQRPNKKAHYYPVPSKTV